MRDTVLSSEVRCPVCRGKGYTVGTWKKCYLCDGKGTLEASPRPNNHFPYNNNNTNIP